MAVELLQSAQSVLTGYEYAWKIAEGDYSQLTRALVGSVASSGDCLNRWGFLFRTILPSLQEMKEDDASVALEITKCLKDRNNNLLESLRELQWLLQEIGQCFELGKLRELELEAQKHSGLISSALSLLWNGLTCVGLVAEEEENNKKKKKKFESRFGECSRSLRELQSAVAVRVKQIASANRQNNLTATVTRTACPELFDLEQATRLSEFVKAASSIRDARIYRIP